MAHTIQAVQRGDGAAVSPMATFRVQLDQSEPIYINCGFYPSRVEVLHKDGGLTAHTMYIWNLAMNDGTGSDSSTGADDNSWFSMADAGDISFPGTGGPEYYAGEELDSTGASLGTVGKGIMIAAGAITTGGDNDLLYITCWR